MAPQELTFPNLAESRAAKASPCLSLASIRPEWGLNWQCRREIVLGNLQLHPVPGMVERQEEVGEASPLAESAELGAAGTPVWVSGQAGRVAAAVKTLLQVRSASKAPQLEAGVRIFRSIRISWPVLCFRYLGR